MVGIESGTKPLPLEFPGIHQMNREETQAALRILKSRSPFRYYGIKLGREVEQFEAELARFPGVRYAVAVGSGTGALQVALAALAWVRAGGHRPGLHVGFCSGSRRKPGAIPVLADIDETFCMDPADLEKRITARTSGIIVVHMSGAPANIEALVKVARQRELFVLEDCAQCAGEASKARRWAALVIWLPSVFR